MGLSSQAIVGITWINECQVFEGRLAPCECYLQAWVPLGGALVTDAEKSSFQSRGVGQRVQTCS